MFNEAVFNGAVFSQCSMHVQRIESLDPHRDDGDDGDERPPPARLPPALRHDLSACVCVCEGGGGGGRGFDLMGGVEGKGKQGGGWGGWGGGVLG
jgi:hypothetical protein